MGFGNYIPASCPHGVLVVWRLQRMRFIQWLMTFCCFSISCSEFNLEALSDKELMAVEILLTTVSYIGKSMVSLSASPRLGTVIMPLPPKVGPPSDVTKLLQVMEQVEVQETPVLAARTARKWKWFIIL